MSVLRACLVKKALNILVLLLICGKRVTKKSKNALENRVFDFALVSPSEYGKG